MSKLPELEMSPEKAGKLDPSCSQARPINLLEGFGQKSADLLAASLIAV